MGSMLKMRQEVKSARSAISAGETLHGVLGRHAYTWTKHGQQAKQGDSIGLQVTLTVQCQLLYQANPQHSCKHKMMH
jgi:hypothetical protein